MLNRESKNVSIVICFISCLLFLLMSLLETYNIMHTEIRT